MQSCKGEQLSIAEDKPGGVRSTATEMGTPKALK